jgi:hypothetical protein
MPLWRCDTHGLQMTEFCCRHIASACQEGRSEQHFVEPESGGRLNLCRHCHEEWLAIPVRYRQKQESPVYYAFFNLLTSACETCLEEWIERCRIRPIAPEESRTMEQ